MYGISALIAGTNKKPLAACYSFCVKGQSLCDRSSIHY